MMCNECGKEFPVLYLSQYVYKRGAKYFCSWSCMRKFDKEKIDMNKKANTTPAKRPGRPKKTETPAVLKVDGPLKIETPEANKVQVVETPEKGNPFLFHTAAVRNERLGTFYYDDKHNLIDWTHPSGDEISITPEDMELFEIALPQILHTLGFRKAQPSYLKDALDKFTKTCQVHETGEE